MVDAKKGLRLLSFSIILQIAWGIFNAFCPGFIAEDSTFRTYLPVITQSIILLCYLVDFAGLRLAGHDSEYFHKAWKLKIISLLLVLAAIIFAIVVAVNKDTDLRKKLAVFEMVVDIIIAINAMLVLLYVINGCLEIAPRVSGLSKFVGGLFTLQTILIITMEVLSYVILKNDISSADTNNPIIIGAAVCAIIFSICAILFLLLYILLIFRTTANVGKARKR